MPDGVSGTHWPEKQVSVPPQASFVLQVVPLGVRQSPLIPEPVCQTPPVKDPGGIAAQPPPSSNPGVPSGRTQFDFDWVWKPQVPLVR